MADAVEEMERLSELCQAAEQRNTEPTRQELEERITTLEAEIQQQAQTHSRANKATASRHASNIVILHRAIARAELAHARTESQLDIERAALRGTMWAVALLWEKLGLPSQRALAQQFWQNVPKTRLPAPRRPTTVRRWRSKLEYRWWILEHAMGMCWKTRHLSREAGPVADQQGCPLCRYRPPRKVKVEWSARGLGMCV